MPRHRLGLVRGKFVDRFEQETSQFTGAKYAVACATGTAALHRRAPNRGVVTAGDEVIVPTVTFIASINSVRYVDAHPVFMDCDEYYNLDTEKTRDFILQETVFKDGHTYNRATNRRIAAVMPVHVFGNAVWLDELLPLCRERNIKVIEDAAESIGSKYMAGNSRIGTRAPSATWVACHSTATRSSPPVAEA